VIPYIVEEILGNKLVTGARLKNTESCEAFQLECEEVFVAIGQESRTEVFKDLVETDEKGFIMV